MPILRRNWKAHVSKPPHIPTKEEMDKIVEASGSVILFDKKGFAFDFFAKKREVKETKGDGIPQVILDYKKKMVKRLEIFYKESQRMDTKVIEIFEKLKKDHGVKIEKLSVDKSVIMSIKDRRKRGRLLRIDISATKEDISLYGSMQITPASIKLSLTSRDIYFEKPMYYLTYYRNLVIKDNYLAAMVKGKKLEKKPTVDIFDGEIDYNSFGRI